MAKTNFLNRYDELVLRANAIDNAVRILADSIIILISAVEKEDGKQLSRRLTKKIQEQLDSFFERENRVVISMSYASDSVNEISFYLTLDGSYHVPGRLGGYTEYIDSELYTRIRFPKGDKIDAGAIIADARATLKSNARIAYKYNEGVKNYDAYKAKYESALETFKRICGETNPLFWDSQVFVYDSKYKAWEEERDNYLNS